MRVYSCPGGPPSWPSARALRVLFGTRPSASDLLHHVFPAFAAVSPDRPHPVSHPSHRSRGLERCFSFARVRRQRSEQTFPLWTRNLSSGSGSALWWRLKSPPCLWCGLCHSSGAIAMGAGLVTPHGRVRSALAARKWRTAKRKIPQVARERLRRDAGLLLTCAGAAGPAQCLGRRFGVAFGVVEAEPPKMVKAAFLGDTRHRLSRPAGRQPFMREA